MRGALLSLVLLGVLVGAGSVFWRRTDDPAAGSEVARHLLVVARDVESLRSRTGALPVRLSELPGFPADAVEWEIEDFSKQLVVPQLEFFYVRTSEGYILVARLADEIWVYDSADARPLRRVPQE